MTSKINVVFTGPAVDGNGQRVLRQNLTAAAHNTGNLQVQASVRPDTQILVASRTDTVKAKTATSRGLTVLTYPQFIAGFLRGQELPTDSQFNPYTDGAKVDPDLLVPVFDPNFDLQAALEKEIL